MRAARGRVLLCAVLGLVGSAVLPVSHAGAAVPAMHDRDVLPPGQGGDIPTNQYSTDQIPLYSGLTPLAGNVTPNDIQTYFKDDPIGSTDGKPEYVPIAGLRILRDSYDVPHIFGQTRAATEFGAGWVAAEDRGFILQAIRGPGAVAALDVPGIDALGLATSLQQFDESAATKKFLASELNIAGSYGAIGRQTLADLKAYVQGINSYYRYSHSTNTPWTANDVVGAAALIGAVFGRGGGDQVNDSAILAALQDKLGTTQGMKVFTDLRNQQNPNTPTTLQTRFTYLPLPTGPTPGSAVIDAASVKAVNPLTPRRHMSNALLVSPTRSVNGNAVAVMGPQVGYYYPEILMEMDIHGGGLNARGATFPGTSLYVEIGRGPNYAWTATSSDSENVDQFLEKLCNPDGSAATRSSTHYYYQGHCIPEKTFDAGYLHPGGGKPGGEIIIHETVNGPISGTCTVHGVPYAIATKRSTYGRDVASALGFEQLNNGSVHSAQSFISAVSHIEFTFNWFYTDAQHIALYSSGRLPARAPGVNPTLPTYGNGNYQWRGFLSTAAHPHAIAPATGQLVNWNNQPALGWGASSDNWNEGPIDHVLLLSNPIPAKDNTPATLASAMNQGADQDPRGVLVWPTIDKLLSSGPAPDPRAAQAADLVSQWVKAGGYLLDTTGDGKVDMPGAAILDAAWSGLVKADLSPVVGDIWQSIPSDGMSYLDQDLRTLMGAHLAYRYSRIYCGNGELGACRASLWAAIDQAAAHLAATQGANPTSWRLADQPITFTPGVLPNTMPYTNRPTFQQVVSYG